MSALVLQFETIANSNKKPTQVNSKKKIAKVPNMWLRKEDITTLSQKSKEVSKNIITCTTNKTYKGYWKYFKQFCTDTELENLEFITSKTPSSIDLFITWWCYKQNSNYQTAESVRAALRYYYLRVIKCKDR